MHSAGRFHVRHSVSSLCAIIIANKCYQGGAIHDAESGDHAVMLRLSPAFHAELRRLAVRERRSLHGQIVYMLERALQDEREEKASA